MLNSIVNEAYRIAKIRAANDKHNSIEPVELLKHTASECIEATEALVSLSDREHFADELADIVMCVFILAGEMNVDMDMAVTRCLEKNRKRSERKGDKL